MERTLRRDGPKHSTRQIPTSRLSRLRVLVDELAEVFAPQGADDDVLIQLVLRFVASVRQHFVHSRAGSTPPGLDYVDGATRQARLVSAEPLRHPKIPMALAVIECLCTDPRLRLIDVSDAVGLSPGYLDKLMKRDTSLGFCDHLRSARIALAERRLRETSDSIKAIALTVGFAHVSSFDRAFTKIHGCPPSQWRTRRSGDRPVKASGW
jgi:AraC-like DNA-binding protein